MLETSTESLVSDDQCGISYSDLVNPVMTPCKHLFCFNCIYKVIHGHFAKLCPACLEDLGSKGWKARDGLITNHSIPSPRVPVADRDYGLVGQLPRLDEERLDQYIGPNALPTLDHVFASESTSESGADSGWDEPDASDDPDWVPGPGPSSSLELESDPDIQLQSATPVILCMEGRTQGGRYHIQLGHQVVILTLAQVRSEYPEALESFRAWQRSMGSTERARLRRQRIRARREESSIQVRIGRPPIDRVGHDSSVLIHQ